MRNYLKNRYFKLRRFKKEASKDDVEQLVWELNKWPVRKQEKRFYRLLHQIMKLFPNCENDDCILAEHNNDFDPHSLGWCGEHWTCKMCDGCDCGHVKKEDCLLWHFSEIARIRGMNGPCTNQCP